MSHLSILQPIIKGGIDLESLLGHARINKVWSMTHFYSVYLKDRSKTDLGHRLFFCALRHDLLASEMPEN